MKTIKCLFIFLMSTIVTNCDKAPEIDAISSDSQGVVSGFAKLFTDDGGGLSSEGTLVSIDNLNPPLTTMTNADGSYRFAEVPYGIYDLSFEKEGHGRFRMGDIVHNQETTIITERALLGRHSSTQIEEFEVSSTLTDVTISTVTSPPASKTNIRFLRFFFHTSNDVGPDIYTAFTRVLFARSTPYEVTFSFDEIRALGFPTGARIHIIAYGDSFHSSAYKDPDTGMDIFPNLNPNTIGSTSFVIP